MVDASENRFAAFITRRVTESVLRTQRRSIELVGTSVTPPQTAGHPVGGQEASEQADPRVVFTARGEAFP